MQNRKFLRKKMFVINGCFFGGIQCTIICVEVQNNSRDYEGTNTDQGVL